MENYDVEKVHSIGYRLKDAKTTLKRDVKVDVAGIKAGGMDGEVLNVPRWVGKILEENRLATLESPDMVTELKQALAKEKMVGEYQISTLDTQFYIKLREAMEGLEGDKFDRVESMLLELFRMRRGKIVKLADSAKMSPELYGKMTVEEGAFYQTIHDNSKGFERQIMGGADE